MTKQDTSLQLYSWWPRHGSNRNAFGGCLGGNGVGQAHASERDLALGNGEMLPTATTWIDLEIIELSEISQTENVKNHTISLICGI